MFDEIIAEAESKVSALLQEKHGMAAEEANRIANTVGKSFMDIVQQQVQQKQLSSIKEIFSGNVTAPDHLEVQKMIPVLTKSLTDSGVEAGKASDVSTTVTPELFNLFNDKVAIARQNGINIPALIEQLSAGGFGGFGGLMSMAGSFLKGGKSKMLSDMMAKFGNK